MFDVREQRVGSSGRNTYKCRSRLSGGNSKQRESGGRNDKKSVQNMHIDGSRALGYEQNPSKERMVEAKCEPSMRVIVVSTEQT